MSEPHIDKPWWVVPSGHIRPIWWLAAIPLMIWADYAAGSDNRYPLLYVVPVCIAAWYSGVRPALAQATVMPIAHLTFLFTIWNAPPNLANLVMLLVRASSVGLIAFVFARQAEYERALRRDMERRHAMELRAEQLRVVHVTMRSVQDIVNNCLNQLQLLRMDAEGVVPAESLETFDQAVREATAKIRDLSELQTFAEKRKEIGMGLDTEETS